MSPPRQSPGRLAWRSACSICKALFQCFYSAVVIFLSCLTAFVAYVAFLDAIPVPDFIIREIHDGLKTKGLTLRMDRIRFQPNGRVIVDHPQLFSPELGSTVIAADQAVAKIKIARLMLGRFALDELRVSNGSFIVPAMLTPSGEPSTAVEAINLEAELVGEQWKLQYANLSIDGLKVSTFGAIKDDYFRVEPKSDLEPRPSASAIIMDWAPKIARLQQELKRFTDPTCIIDLSVTGAGQQQAALLLQSSAVSVTDKIKIDGLRFFSHYRARQPISAQLTARSITLPNEMRTEHLALSSHWDELPTLEKWLPSYIQASTTEFSYKDLSLPSLIGHFYPSAATHRAHLQLSLANAPLSLELDRDNSSKQLRVDLLAQLDPSLPSALSPFAQGLGFEELEKKATLGRAVDLHAKAMLDSDLQPVEALVTLQSGSATILGASIDHSNMKARLRGPEIDIESLRIQSGIQSAELTVGFNRETLLRRIQVEGKIDPTMINGWFKPWWTAMWEGMAFSDEGIYGALDSQAIVKRPDTVRVTGIAYATDMDLRGIQVEELRTRFFSRFHYVDLYDLELQAQGNQQATGNVQFSMDRDPRDEKDKLTGLWIDVDSTLDVMAGPEVIWEIGESIEEILAPYAYDTPPRIVARSSSVRVEDVYQYDIDLDIETPNAFSFHQFPFDSLTTFVHLENGIADIPNARAAIGGGRFEVSAFIRGEDIDLDAKAIEAGFGQTLNAANAYFAANGSESAQAMDPDRLMAYGGIFDASFSGTGLVGDPLSYVGSGSFDIQDADFGKFQLFGLLSMALEVTPLGFTTLTFDRVSGPFSVDHPHIHFSDIAMDGPVASIRADGYYNIGNDQLDFDAKLFPFRNSRVPLIAPLLNIPLNIVSHFLEVSVSGTLDEPKLRLFNPSTREEVDVGKPIDPRDPRPARK